MATILVIDDSRVVLDFVSLALEREAHRVIAMTDPLAAVDLFVDGSVVVDLVLIDVSMTPISGFETFKRLAAVGFDGPVLFMSGYPGLSSAIIERLGPGAVLEKPFTPAALHMAIDKDLRRTESRRSLISAEMPVPSLSDALT